LKWLGPVIIGLSLTGMRISELATLRWSDVDLDNESIRVADERFSRRRQVSGTARTTKGKRSRSIPIHPRLKSLLAALPRSSDGFVFRAMQGGRLRPNNVLNQFIRGVIEPLKAKFPAMDGEIGFERGRIHSFRHFFCSQALIGGATEGEFREWLGHADSKMVEHYRHLRLTDARRRMQQIDYLAGDEPVVESSEDVAS
jgi:integrase